MGMANSCKGHMRCQRTNTEATAWLEERTLRRRAGLMCRCTTWYVTASPLKYTDFFTNL